VLLSSEDFLVRSMVSNIAGSGAGVVRYARKQRASGAKELAQSGGNEVQITAMSPVCL